MFHSKNGAAKATRSLGSRAEKSNFHLLARRCRITVYDKPVCTDAMNRKWQLPRRTFLRGLGTTISLPLLEAMVRPWDLFGAEPASAAPPRARPVRMAFLYVPNGINMADWTPQSAGTDYAMPAILEPLQGLRPNFQIISGLAQDKAQPNGDGAGDHARASATFLTGCQARKTAGADIRVGISVDQVAAAQLGRATRLPSLELSCDRGQEAGSCDSGYSCAYQFHISWRSETTPNPVEVDPRQVFERLFGNGNGPEMQRSRQARDAHRKSILDFAMEDAKRLQSNLGKTDQRKLEEYLTSVREVEQRIENAQQFAASLPDYSKPTGIPKDYEAQMRLLMDLLVLAFQTDTTRVASFILAHDGDNRPYPFIGVSDGHHDLSHHENKAEKKQKLTRINRFHATQLAYFLSKLKSTPEGETTLLDHCMIVYGSGIGDGNAHNHDNLPVILAGGGAGTLTPGRHWKLDGKVPMANLYLAMLDRIGAPTAKLGDSTGKLENL